LIGILPLKSYKMAVNLNEKVPGIDIPEKVLERLKDGGREEGINIAVEFIKRIRSEVAGIHIMPLGSTNVVLEIISRVDDLVCDFAENNVQMN